MKTSVKRERVMPWACECVCVVYEGTAAEGDYRAAVVVAVVAAVGGASLEKCKCGK